ncbi:DUF1828 domain-containing protein [Brevundimonas sp.]|uniref:DUF1828 domain-containing protein n=1 Tax=Brevundimonas sp. TaxID=1871086 RepID=UPI003A94F971
MNIQDDICEALCGGFDVRRLKIGYAIRSPFTWFTGDNLTIYARIDEGRVRIEDDAASYAELTGAGVDFSTDTRLGILSGLMAEHGVEFDEIAMRFQTRWLSGQEAGAGAARFLAFMHRLQDLVFTTRDRVSNTFREDLFAALSERLGNEAEISLDEAVADGFEDYVVDILVKHRSGKRLAIFTGTSEARALEAIILAKELEINRADNVVPFLIYQETNSKRVSRKTQSRAINSDLQLGTWEGGMNDVLSKVERHAAING